MFRQLNISRTIWSVHPEGWKQLLQGRGVDGRIVDFIVEMAMRRAIGPPTTETKQLLIAVEQDGYAAGRVGAAS
jgi:hypothetical protein